MCDFALLSLSFSVKWHSERGHRGLQESEQLRGRGEDFMGLWRSDGVLMVGKASQEGDRLGIVRGQGDGREKACEGPRREGWACFPPLPTLPQNQVAENGPLYHETKGAGAGIA